MILGNFEENARVKEIIRKALYEGSTGLFSELVAKIPKIHMHLRIKQTARRILVIGENEQIEQIVCFQIE